jgi:hypothetical protein
MLHCCTLQSTSDTINHGIASDIHLTPIYSENFCILVFTRTSSASKRLLGLLGLLHGRLGLAICDGLIADWLDHPFVDLAILVHSRVIDPVNPSLLPLVKVLCGVSDCLT